MEINTVDPQSTPACPLANLHGTDPEVEQGPDQTPEAGEPSEPTPIADESSVEQTSEDTDAEGVLRLLQEGHFKGVSDVRLRINFFDELAAIEAGQLQAVAEENVDGVLQAVGTVIGTMAEEGGPAVESTPEVPAEVLGLQETFAQAVNQLKDDFLAAEVPSIAALDEGIQSVFDAFVESLEAALAPAPDTGDLTAEEATPDDGGDEPADVDAAAEQGGEVTEPPATLESGPGLEGFIAELRAAFEAAMDELIEAFGEVAVLPELSEPSGNGVAYEKFLAIYNEMRGVAPADEASQPAEPLEAEG
ncbi:MAG: hypothetical protein ACYTBX_02130 [Planctomycetota bacterium]|jgi:hypothetical protein